jgi:hypothetical protein
VVANSGNEEEEAKACARAGARAARTSPGSPSKTDADPGQFANCAGLPAETAAKPA